MWKTAEVHKGTSWRNLDKTAEQPKKLWKRSENRMEVGRLTVLQKAMRILPQISSLFVFHFAEIQVT